MRPEKQEAIELRKTGKSYKEIQSILGIPKSTISDWFKNEEWSKDIAKKLNKESSFESTKRLVSLNGLRKIHLADLYVQAQNEAKEEFGFLKNDPLFISGMMIYWGEGDKRTSGQVRVSNSDPEMIKIFLSFLNNVCGSSRDRIWLNLLVYPDHDIKKNQDFWQSFLDVDESLFQKTVVLKGKEKSKRLEYGICNVGISSRYLKEKMLIWLKLLKDELIANL